MGEQLGGPPRQCVKNVCKIGVYDQTAFFVGFEIVVAMLIFVEYVFAGLPPGRPRIALLYMMRAESLYQMLNNVMMHKSLGAPL